MERKFTDYHSDEFKSKLHKMADESRTFAELKLKLKLSRDTILRLLFIHKISFAPIEQSKSRTVIQPGVFLNRREEKREKAVNKREEINQLVIIKEIDKTKRLVKFRSSNLTFYSIIDTKTNSEIKCKAINKLNSNIERGLWSEMEINNFLALIKRLHKLIEGEREFDFYHLDVRRGKYGNLQVFLYKVFEKDGVVLKQSVKHPKITRYIKTVKSHNFDLQRERKHIKNLVSDLFLLSRRNLTQNSEGVEKRKLSLKNTLEKKARVRVNSIYNGVPNTMGSSNFKELLYRLGDKKPICENCGLTEWLEKPISLHLDHKDGNHFNNSKNNLQILCPNCHSQTSTYAGKKRK